jgi:hypothetical protein
MASSRFTQVSTVRSVSSHEPSASPVASLLNTDANLGNHIHLQGSRRTSPVSCGTRTGTEDANAASVTGPARQLRRLVLLLPRSQSWLISISLSRKPICAHCGQLSLLDLTSRGTKAFAAFTSCSSSWLCPAVVIAARPELTVSTNHLP